jgi:hypothetical protein
MQSKVRNNSCFLFKEQLGDTPLISFLAHFLALLAVTVSFSERAFAAPIFDATRPIHFVGSPVYGTLESGGAASFAIKYDDGSRAILGVNYFTGIPGYISGLSGDLSAPDEIRIDSGDGLYSLDVISLGPYIDANGREVFLASGSHTIRFFNDNGQLGYTFSSSRVSRGNILTRVTSSDIPTPPSVALVALGAIFLWRKKYMKA